MCDTRLFLDTASPQVYNVGNSNLLLVNVASYELVCNRTFISNYAGCEICKVNIPCECALRTGRELHYGLTHHCLRWESENNTQSLPKHIIPLSILTSFFDREDFKQFTAEARSMHPVNITLPDLTVYQSEYTREVEQLRGSSIQMRSIENVTRNTGALFTSLSHKLSRDLEEARLSLQAVTLSPFSLSYWSNLIATVLASLAILACAVLYFRLKAIGIALVLLQRPVSAAPADSDIPLIFDYGKYTTALTTPAQFVPVIVEHLNMADLTLIFLFLLFWINIAHKMFRRYHPQHNFTVSVEIGNSSESIKIPVATVRHTPDLYTFRARRFLREVRVTGIINCHAHVLWPDLEITSKVTSAIHHINSRQRISCLTAIKLRAILQTDYHILVFTRDSQSTSFYLMNLENTSWTGLHSLRTNQIGGNSGSYHLPPYAPGDGDKLYSVALDAEMV